MLMRKESELIPVSDVIDRLVDLQAPGLRQQVQRDREIKPLLEKKMALLEELIALLKGSAK